MIAVNAFELKIFNVFEKPINDAEYENVLYDIRSCERNILKAFG